MRYDSTASTYCFGIYEIISSARKEYDVGESCDVQKRYKSRSSLPEIETSPKFAGNRGTLLLEEPRPANGYVSRGSSRTRFPRRIGVGGFGAGEGFRNWALNSE